MNREIKLTKSKLVDYLSVLSSALEIYDKFTIINDIIDPSVPEEETDVDDDVFGAHRLRHPLFTLPSGRVFNSVPNIGDVISEIKKITGIKNINLISTDYMLAVDMDGKTYVLAMSNGIDTGNYKLFDSIVDKYFSNEVYRFTDEQLLKCRMGSVITINHDEFGPVRLSKSNFPFHGVARSDSPVNFSGVYSYGYYDKEVGVNYIAMHITYKRCEAVHVYVYAPFNVEIPQ
jgi:hypothetical protein